MVDVGRLADDKMNIACPIILTPAWRSVLVGFFFCFMVLSLQADEASGDTANHGSKPWKAVRLADLLLGLPGQPCAEVKPGLLRCSGQVTFHRLSQLRIDGNGTRVEFADPRRGKGGLLFLGARNIVLSGGEIGWEAGGIHDASTPSDLRIQTLGRVAACSGSTAPGGQLHLDLPLNGSLPLAAVSYWDDATGWTWEGASSKLVEKYFPPDTTARFREGMSDCIPDLSAMVGGRVLVRHFVYANHAFACSACWHVTVENVRVTSAPGMAFAFSWGGGDLTLRANIVAPRCSPGCSSPEPSVTADASHFAAVGGPIRVEGNDFGWQGDDSLNITGLMAPFRVDPDGGSGWASIGDQWRSRLSLFSAGNEVLLFDGGLNALGSARILDKQMDSRLRLSWLPANVSDVVLAPADKVPSDIEVRNNHFHDHRARGILMGGANARIEDNVIERVTMAAILLPADTHRHFEGPGAQRVLIRGNRISHVNRFPYPPDYPAAISASVQVGEGYKASKGTSINHIQIEDNIFSDLKSFPEQPVHLDSQVIGAEASP